MGYYSAIKRNELLIHSMTQMNLKIMYAEHKVYIQYNTIYIKLQEIQTIVVNSRSVVGWGKGGEGMREGL